MTGASGGFRRIGILGGMGVEATLELLKRVHAATEADDDQDHVPILADINPQVPSRIRHVIEKNGPDPGPVLAQMAARLEKAGAEVLAMPCNTAHLYALQIEENVGIALLNMPKLACARAAQGMQRGEIVGVLASPATNSSGLFDGFLAEYGVTSAYPENEAGILAAIRRIKKSGPTQDDIILLENEAAALVKRGAEKVIVGCSEFSLVSNRIRTSVPIIDSLDVLVSEIVKFSGVRVKPPT
ncbi:aspartate/glutamate racemase family protein [Yoonia sediminilitoris]|uniref:Aspartate racemase n=1 Tax=Yoonia sediminilitoris TaxID=1286148 RepID=A0A2T6KH71_9RHOB|nr:amino acid racemase [Yoonia sediminilitoris]PUB14863.1 aspartate racemase [Yoonia sediminilitoris]RCW95580.1 aspartate racemase [Yoonia sediminilitoris]